MTLSMPTFERDRSRSRRYRGAGATATRLPSAPSCPRGTVLKLPLLLAGALRGPRTARLGGTAQSVDHSHADRWYQAQGSARGRQLHHLKRHQPQLDMFADTFDPRRIDTELGWARVHGLDSAGYFSMISSRLRIPEAPTASRAVCQHCGPPPHQTRSCLLRLHVRIRSPTRTAARPEAWVHNSG